VLMWVAFPLVLTAGCAMLALVLRPGLRRDALREAELRKHAHISRSDAWVTRAVALSDGTLSGVIGAGDAMQHAILTYAELEHALSLLASAGVLTTKNGRFELTQEFGESLGTEATTMRAGSSYLITTRALQSLDLAPDAVRPISPALYNWELYRQAVEVYMSQWPEEYRS
jgi:hypothetical protein